MNRRTFAKLAAAAVAGLFAAHRLIASLPEVAQDAARPVTVIPVRIGLRDTHQQRYENRLARNAGKPQPWPDPPDDEHNYWADLIKDSDRYFYRAGDTTVEISEFEYGYVQSNPSLYYFSQTVKVHVRMKRKRNGLPALPWQAT